MRRVIPTSIYLFILFTLTFGCKTRQNYTLSDAGEMPAGLSIVKDPLEHDLTRINEIGVSNNYSFTNTDLDFALNGGANPSEAKAVMKSTYLYMDVHGKNTMVGYILYQLDSSYITLADIAIDQTLPDETIRQLENAMRLQIISINEEQSKPILNTIFSAHSRKIELMKKIGFQSISEVGGRTVPSGVSETGDTIYQDEYYKFGDAKKEVTDAFADSYQTKALLNRNKVVSNEPELRDRILKSFVDLRDYYRNKFPKKKTEVISNLTVEENVKRALLKKEVGSYILLGDKGGGKSFNLDLIMAKLARGQYPDIDRAIGDFDLLLVDPSQILANTTYRGQLEQKIKSIRERSSTRPIVIYADEVHRLAGVGKSEGSGSDLFESLKEGMADGSIRIIGSTTPQEYYDTFSGRDAVVDRLFIDQFGYLSKPDVISIIKFHLEKRGINASAEVMEKILELSERFEPNGGQVRAKVKFIDDLGADRVLKNASGVLTVADIVAQARRYYGVEKLVFPEQRQGFMQSLANRPAADQIDPSYIDGVYAGLADNASKQITLLAGPEGSGRSFASESIAKVLGRPHVEISLLAFQSPSQFPELMSRIVAELDKKGMSHLVFSFTYSDTVVPDVQRQLVDMLQKGVIITKVYDANTKRSSTRKIKVPNVMAHFILSNPESAPVIANASVHKLEVKARDQSAYSAIVSTKVKQLLQTDEFKSLNLTEAEIAKFVETFAAANYKQGVPFDAHAAKLEIELRKIADGFVLGKKAPAYMKAACDALRAASGK